ncbi:hypothetical protein GCM10028819_33100 [Spirosoma humi]
MTLDAIVDRYQNGTLADEPDLVLLDAQNKVALWEAWRLENPDASPSAVPKASVLHTISVFIEKTTNNRYGCND